MKTILLPTDFSEASKYASEYVFNLFKNTDIKYHLIHSYDPPSSAGALISIEDIVKKDAEDSLKEEIEWMVSKGVSPDKITSSVNFGEFTTVVNREAKKVQADLIVLGTTGASGLKEIIGSNASNLMTSAHIPVLGVPKNFRNNNGKILFPINLSEENSFASLELFLRLTKILNVSIDVFYASSTNRDKYTTIENQKKMITDLFSDVDFNFLIKESDDVIEDILELIDKNDYQMLAMMPHKYGLLKRIFTTSVTSHVAMKTNIPLLAIH